MTQCDRCGSFAINHTAHGRDGSDPHLCDVCYWRKRADLAGTPPVKRWKWDGKAFVENKKGPWVLFSDVR